MVWLVIPCIPGNEKTKASATKVCVRVCVLTCVQVHVYGHQDFYDMYLCFGEGGFGIMSVVSSLDTDVDTNTLTTLIRWKVLVCDS